MLFPPAIDGVCEINEDEDLGSDDEQIEEKVVLQKKIGKSGLKFSSNFNFDVASDGQEELGEGPGPSDDLDGLKRFWKQNTAPDQKEETNPNNIRLAEGTSKSFDPESLNFDEFNQTDTSEKLLQKFTDVSDQVRKKLRKKKSKSCNAEEQQFFDKESDSIVDISSRSAKSFDDLKLSRPILKAVVAAGFGQPTPIQAVCIPVALTGRDICACSATGTGKTAAFVLPILERLLYRPKATRSKTRVLILVPTRELAIQVFQVSRRLKKYGNLDVEISLATGGLDAKLQENALRLNPDIVIATPGRLIEHLQNSKFSLKEIEVLVLDEADRLLDETFSDQLKELIQQCASSRQTMLFSATMTDKVEDLAQMSLKTPVRLFTNENTDITANLRQEFVRIREERDFEREAIAAALISRTFPSNTIVFVRTKKDCQRICELFVNFGIRAGQLHGGIPQKQRIETLYAFKQQSSVKVLCATDLAARGLDIEGVENVINLHMPDTVKQYIHRVGRTARAGNSGCSISLIGERDRKLQKQLSISIQRNIPPQIIDIFMKRVRTLTPESEYQDKQKPAVKGKARKQLKTKVKRKKQAK